jgi:hypothetical protein
MMVTASPIQSPPNAPRATSISRRLQAMLRHIRDGGIHCDLGDVRIQILQLKRMESDLDGYSKSLLDELCQVIGDTDPLDHPRRPPSF